MHGGAHGSGAPSGPRNGNYRHGRRTAEAIRRAGEGHKRELGPQDDALTIAKHMLRTRVQRRSRSDFNRRIIYPKVGMA
jgi:hypothetical protein